MPKFYDIEGVGRVGFPDELSQDEINQLVKRDFTPEEKVGPLESAALAAGEAVIPSFTAAAGAAAAMATPPALAYPPVTLPAAGLVGAVGGGMAGEFAQKKAFEAVLPEEYEEFQRRRALAAKQHPWASWLGELGGAATAFEVRPLQPFRVAMKLPKLIRGTATKPEIREAIGTAVQAGFGIGQAAVQGERDPVELARRGALMMVLGGARYKGFEPRMAPPLRDRPPATPEQIKGRMDLLQKESAEGNQTLHLFDEPLKGNESDIARPRSDGSVDVSLPKLHKFLDNYLPEGTSEGEAIKLILNHEFFHSVTPSDLAKAFEKSMTPLQRWRYRRTYQGPFPEGKAVEGETLGKEALRFEAEKAMNLPVSEYVSTWKQEVGAVKMLDALDKLAGVFRSRARTTSQKAMVEQMVKNVEAAKAAAKKGAPSASEVQEAATVHGDVRAQPVEGVRQVPVQEGGPGVLPQAEGRVEEGAQILLTPKKNRSAVLIKNPPVVKDVPPGSIHPNSIIPAIRLINGDVIHGWIKRNGKAATHPEIAKRYGITIEEIDRKGWLSKDGKAFYEREPAAVGTQLPTGKKEGELHSTDKPAEGVKFTDVTPGARAGEVKFVEPEEAPPTAPTEGAQPVQAPTGLATAPPAELEMLAGGPKPAAEPKISKPTEKVNIPGMTDAELSRLDELNSKITKPDWQYNLAELEEHAALNDKLARAEQAAAAAGGGAPGMRLKESLTPAVVEDEGRTIWEVAPSHGQAVVKHGRAGRVAFQPQNKGFLYSDENGVKRWISREEAVPIYRRLTGREPSDPRALKSEDFKGVENIMDLEQKYGAQTVSRDPTQLFDYSPEDLAEYQRLKDKLSAFPQTLEAIQSKEYADTMRAYENLRNKYNGNPPKQLSQPEMAPGMRLKESAEELRKQYPKVKWSDRQGGPGWYLVSPDAKMAKIDMDHEPALRAMGMSQVEGYNKGWGRGRMINTPQGQTLYVSNAIKSLTTAQKGMLVNYGIENNVTIVDDSGPMATRGARAWMDNVLYDAREMAPGMRFKGEQPTKEEVVESIVRSVGGVGKDPQKFDLVRQTAKLIMGLPRDQWAPALTRFQSQIKQAEIDAAARQLAQQPEPPPSPEQEALEKAMIEAGKLTQAVSGENIEKAFGPADRGRAYRSALMVLNQPPEALPLSEEQLKEKPLQKEGKPESRAVRARYAAPYKIFWDEFHERFPSLPEWAAIDVWNGAVDDFLNNAPGDQLRTLLRPARLERKYLGEAAAKFDPATGKLDVSMLRTIPDPDPDPIIADMIKSPSPQNEPKFKAFCAARDMTVEQGLAELTRLRDTMTREALEAGATPPRMGMALAGGKWRRMTIPEFEEYLDRMRGGEKVAAEPGKKGIVFRPGTREPLTEKELADREKDFIEGRKILVNRRQGVISSLKKWLSREAKLAERSPMRRTVGLDDIWFETREPDGAYAAYDKEQAENASFLKKALGRGSIKGVTGTTTRAITVVVDPKTGDYHAVSTYVREKLPRFYDPAGLPGSKIGQYIDLPQLMSRYRVAASFLLRDPVYNFHQVWKSEKGGPTGEQKFSKEIGDVAGKREDASKKKWLRFIKEAEEERAAERERIRQERFFGGVREEEVTGEKVSKPETTAELEAKAAAGEEEVTAREEEATPSVRERLAREREEAGGRPWEEAEEWETGLEEAGVEKEATARSMETWYAGKAGRGAATWGLFQADLRHLAEETLAHSEAESLYEVWREFKISNPFQWLELIQKAERVLGRSAGIGDVMRLRNANRLLSGRDVSALYAIDKIANRVYDRMANSAYERAKTKGLPPIPEDRLYEDMTPEEKQHYQAVEDLKYRALIQSFREIHDLTQEVTTDKSLAAKAAAKGVTVPDYTVAFRDRALGKFGPDARRELEGAALSAQPYPEISGERTLLAGSKYGGAPRTVIGQRLFTAPRAELPQMMGPAESAAVAEQARVQHPYIRTVPEFQRPLLTPRGAQVELPPLKGRQAPRIGEAEVSPIGPRPQGFVPRPPSRLERLTMPMEDVEKLLREERPTPLREKGTEQYVMRKIMQQSEGKAPEEGPGFTLKGEGVARRYLEEMKAQGRTTWEHQNAPVVTKEQQIAMGRELVSAGKVIPEKRMRQFELQEANRKWSGQLSIEDGVAFRYWAYKLQGWADAAAKGPGGTDSEAFKKAFEMSNSWKRRMDGTREHFARMGLGLQGWNQIGPDDMKSTTFIARFMRKAKAIARGEPEGEDDLSDEDMDTVKRIANENQQAEDVVSQLSMLAGETTAKWQDPALDPGQQQIVTQFDQMSKKAEESASARLRGKKPPPGMPLKADESELPELDSDTMDDLGNIGFRVMAELSKAGGMTDELWLTEMKKRLHSPEVDRPDLEPYLPKVRLLAEQVRDAALNNFIGTGDATKDARNIFKRKRPPIEESIAAIRRALQADPSGQDITPAEAYHVWNYLKTRFFDKGILDFQKIRRDGAAELGIKDNLLGVTETPYPEIRLFRAMTAKRSMRTLGPDLLKAMRNEARIKGQAMNWLKNQEFPWWLRTLRAFPRMFFWDKIIGHGFVPMITHAPTMLFNPMAWSEYFGTYRNGVWKPGAWQEMYRMSVGTKPFNRLAAKMGIGEWKGMTGEDYHAEMVAALRNHEHFEFWKKNGLQVDPFLYTDDYQIMALQNIMGKRMTALLGGRGFDALKTLRFAMAEKWLNSLPEHLRNEKSAKLIADSVNHATGIVKSKFWESANWAFFAPKLEASRWAYIFKDTIKAGNYIANWKTASLEQRAWATAEMKQKGQVVAWYAGMLALNQAFLWMLGSNQKVNVTDPKKADFMQFKVLGFRVGVTSPMAGMVRLFAKTLHAAAGERTKFEQLTSRQRQLGEIATEYARGKASPLASFGLDIATQEDIFRRKLPWSAEQPSFRQLIRGTAQPPYTPGEYLSQTFAPIPIEEAVRETFRSEGMTDQEALRWIRILTIAGGMATTGARVATDQP